MQGLYKYLTPQILIGTTAAIAVVSVLFAFAYTSRRPVTSYVTPERGAIVDEVDTTGSVKAAESVDLSFDTSGRIASVRAAVGSQVAAGQTLATLAGGDQAAALAQAQAALDMQIAKLNGLKAGTRSEDVAVSQAAVTGAQSGVSTSKEAVLAAGRDAYVKADDAIHNRVDQFMNNPRSNQPSLNINFPDTSLQNTVLNGRVTMEALLSSWKAYLDSLPAADTVVSGDVAAKTRANAASVSSYLDSVASGLSNVTPSSNITLTTVQKYQSDVATARTNMSAAVTALNQAETAEKLAETGLATAQSQLALKQAGATATDLQAQEAQVAAAQANVQAAESQASKTSLRSPISGVVSKNDAHVGATASPGTLLISVISNSKFQMEAFISEADLARAKKGSSADISLDAYQNEPPFKATIVGVDPAATIQNGIPSYKITLQFVDNDPRIQVGLTGNIRIVAGQKDNVLSVPSSAIIMRGADHYVLVQGRSGDDLQKVVIGIQSADGRTEVLSGLTGSERIRGFGTQ